MATSYPTSADQIGNTALIDISALVSDERDPADNGYLNTHGVPVRVLGKAEFVNPGLSHKDRIVSNILDKAESTGKLTRGSGQTLVAASSGNTGASVSMIGAMRGYKVVIITNNKCSKEKCDAIKMYGAELRIAEPGQDYMKIELELAEANPTWFSINQYESQDNPEAHYKTTGPEIYEQTNGSITHFVMAASTGGTISGVGKYLKEQNKDVQIILADPDGSVLKGYVEHGEIQAGDKKKFLVEGVGKGSIPGAFHANVVDSCVRTTDQEAVNMCHRLAKEQGLTVGGSAGCNAHAAVEIARASKTPAVIVTLLCDSGIKYLSKIYNNDWITENGLQVPSTSA